MQHSLIKFLQKRTFKASNSFEPKKTPGIQKLDSGVSFYNDIRYGGRYPNSFLDVYALPDAGKVLHQTLFMVHGGGFTWGDKTDGGLDSGEGFWFFRSFLEAGFNLVSINYALAPDYAYPTPIHQMGEAVQFLQTHGPEYGLDITRIVFWGGSAGGQLIGQFVNIQTNPAYAKEMNIEPVLNKTHIKAMIFNSALLDNERFGKTNDWLTNVLFTKCGQAYFQTQRLPGNQNVIQSNVIRNVSGDFPPSFISDANHASFSDQARDLEKTLTRLGIPHTFNFYPRKEQKLFHGFEVLETEYGKDNMQKMLAFLKDHVG